MTLQLTPDQDRALAEILAAREPGSRYLLTGYAGSGKTTLMQEVARALLKKRLSVVMTAPTHKAVSVLSAKLRQAGIGGVECRTIHSLLSLKPRAHGDRQLFERNKRADPVMEDVVVIDECSMVSAELMVHIKRHLPMSFVLFVGEAAYHLLMTGGKAVTLAYQQGTGNRAVTYTMADRAGLAGYIASLKRQLGQSCGRRAIGLRF
jgi:exodeoxyribonuclease-5